MFGGVVIYVGCFVYVGLVVYPGGVIEGVFLVCVYEGGVILVVGVVVVERMLEAGGDDEENSFEEGDIILDFIELEGDFDDGFVDDP